MTLARLCRPLTLPPIFTRKQCRTSRLVNVANLFLAYEKAVAKMISKT